MTKLIGVALLLAGCAWAQSDTKVFEHPCRDVRGPSMRAMVENGFTPTVIDKDSGIATFVYKNMIPIGSKWGQRKAADAVLTQFVKIPSYAHGYFGAVILDLRIDSASLLFDEQGERCTVSSKINYALFVRGAGWRVAESNAAFEGRLLDLAYYRLLDAAPGK